MTVTPSSAYRGSYATIEPTVSCPEAALRDLGYSPGDTETAMRNKLDPFRRAPHPVRETG